MSGKLFGVLAIASIVTLGSGMVSNSP